MSLMDLTSLVHAEFQDFCPLPGGQAENFGCASQAEIFCESGPLAEESMRLVHLQVTVPTCFSFEKRVGLS